MVYLNGCSYERDFGYRELVEGWSRTGDYPVTYIPTVSRPADPSNAGWTGRTGRVESIVAPVCRELDLTADSNVLPERLAKPKNRPPYFSIETEPFDQWRLDVKVIGNEFLKVRSPFFTGVASAAERAEMAPPPPG